MWALGLLGSVSNEVGLACAAAQDVAHLTARPADVRLSLGGEGEGQHQQDVSSSSSGSSGGSNMGG